MAIITDKGLEELNKAAKSAGMDIKFRRAEEELMSEETEIPEICKKYDEVSDAIVKYESDIESMENEVIEKTEKVKEYLQILKDGTEVSMTRDPALVIIEPGAVILDPLSYYRRKIQELNDQLLKIDNEIKSKNANLQDYYKELEKIKELIPETGMTKIHPNIFGNYKWVTLEELESKYKKTWYTRIV